MHPGTLHLLLSFSSIVNSIWTHPGTPECRAVSGRFRDGFGCPRTKIAPRKTKDLCAIVENSWASDCKHNCDLQAYHRGGLHSRPALPTYRRGAFSESSSLWKRQFWKVPADKRPERNSRSRTHRSSATPALHGLRIRPYLHACISRITVVEQLPQIEILLLIIIMLFISLLSMYSI